MSIYIYTWWKQQTKREIKLVSSCHHKSSTWFTQLLDNEGGPTHPKYSKAGCFHVSRPGVPFWFFFGVAGSVAAPASCSQWTCCAHLYTSVYISAYISNLHISWQTRASICILLDYEVASASESMSVLLCIGLALHRHRLDCGLSWQHCLRHECQTLFW